MRDAFYEESVSSLRKEQESRRYTILRVVSIITYVIGGFLLFFSLYVVPDIVEKTSGLGLALSLVQWFLPIVFFIGTGIFFTRFKRRYNVSYDYIFVEDELRVSKVFNGKKRKFLFKLKADSILKLGLCERDSYERTLAGQNRKPIYLTPNRDEAAEGKIFIYLVYSDVAGKDVYVLECREMLLEYLVMAAGKNKLELQ